MSKELRNLIDLTEAIDIVSREIDLKLSSEYVSTRYALFRAASKDVIAHHHLPFFNKSVVDGYAVRAEDTYGASEYNPIPLKIIGEATFTTFDKIYVRRGEAAKIFTGVPLPSGANAVVMVEDVIEDNGVVYVMRGVGEYTNVAMCGEDIEKGRIVVGRGCVVEYKHIAALTALGINGIDVYEKIRVCIISTGDEVVELGSIDSETAHLRGLVFNSTAFLLESYMNSLNIFTPIYLGIMKDDVQALASALKKSIDICHCVIVTGGAGPSSHDFSVEAVKRIGGRVLVRGIAIRPGRPTSAAIVDEKPVFMLSGFPVASFIGFKFFVLPVIEKSLNIAIPRRYTRAKLSRRVANVAGYVSFVRVKLIKCDNDLCAEPLASMGSGSISTLLNADGIIIIPSNVEGFNEGSYVDVELL